MLDRLLNAWLLLRQSLWFIPLLMSLGGVLLAYVATSLDDGGVGLHSWFYVGDPEDARDLLGNLLSSMITMTTLVISITMVVLSLAANQLGSRLIRIFMSDLTTKIVLGVFPMTIAYLISVLSSVTEVSEARAVPHVAVTAGTGLALLDVFVLLYFVHHLARSLVTNYVVARVAAELRETIARLRLPQSGQEDVPETEWPPDEAGAPVTLDRAGYVQAIAHGELVESARRAQARIRLSHRPGHFVFDDAPFAFVHPPGQATPELVRAIRRSVAMGSERTPTQDVEYSVRHLVEIALRALSPGINDPFTAQTVLDNMGAALAEALRSPRRGPRHRDAEGVVRVVGPASDDRGLLEAAFNQIRQAAEPHPSVLIRLLETLSSLAAHARTDEQREALRMQADAALAAAERSISEPLDLAAVRERHEAAVAALSRAAAAR